MLPYLWKQWSSVQSRAVWLRGETLSKFRLSQQQVLVLTLNHTMLATLHTGAFPNLLRHSYLLQDQRCSLSDAQCRNSRFTEVLSHMLNKVKAAVSFQVSKSSIHIARFSTLTICLNTIVCYSSSGGCQWYYQQFSKRGASNCASSSCKTSGAWNWQHHYIVDLWQGKQQLTMYLVTLHAASSIHLNVTVYIASPHVSSWRVSMQAIELTICYIDCQYAGCLYSVYICFGSWGSICLPQE